MHYFKSEDQAADVAEGGVIDLGDVEEVRKADSKGIEIVTESRLWQLRADSANTQETWYVAGERTRGLSSPRWLRG